MKTILNKIKINIFELLIIVWGLSGVFFLATNNLFLLSQVQSLGSVPIPLVFDAPQGYEFWSQNYSFEIITNKNHYLPKAFDKSIYQRFPRHSIIHNSILIPLAMSPVLDEKTTEPIFQTLFCYSNNWHPFVQNFSENERILKFIFISKVKTIEVLCP